MSEKLDEITSCAYCGEDVGEGINDGWYRRLENGAVICEDCFYEERGNEPKDVALGF